MKHPLQVMMDRRRKVKKCFTSVSKGTPKQKGL